MVWDRAGLVCRTKVLIWKQKPVLKYATRRYYIICCMEKAIRNRLVGKHARISNTIIQEEWFAVLFPDDRQGIDNVMALFFLLEELITF